MIKYTAIIATNSLNRLQFSSEFLLANSRNCKELLIVWDGDDISAETAGLAAYDFNMKYGIKCRVLRRQQNQDVYGMFNYGASQAKCDYVLFCNDDMYCSIGFDEGLDFVYSSPVPTERMVVTFQVVEPGYVDVNAVNIRMDFGQTIDSFDKNAFDKYANLDESTDVFECKQLIDGSISLGWYMPVIFSKSLFSELGQYPTFPPFPHPNDIILFDRLRADRSIYFIKLNSRIYHFQRLSQRPTESYHVVPFDKLNLCCGEDRKDGWLNVDMEFSDFNVDVSKGVLPFENQSFSEILFKHAIEHFRLEETEKIMVEVLRILKPDGFIDIYAPEMSLACADYLDGVNQFPNCADSINRLYGKNTSLEQVHKYGYTAKISRSNNIISLLQKWGFSRTEALSCRDFDEFGVRAFK